VPTLEARGVELAWEQAGSGPTVVLVHETATSSVAWQPLAEALSEAGARAVTYDRRGWGASSAPDGYRRTTIEEQSEDLAELTAAVGPPAVACGAGIGAVIALDLLLRRPDLLEAAVLIEPHLPGLVPRATELLSEDRGSVIDAVNEGGVAAVVELYLSGGLAGLGPGVDRLPRDLGTAAGEHPASLLAELGATTAWAMPLGRLAAAERPAAILTCPDTPDLIREAADALASRLPRSVSRAAPDAGPPHLVSPETVVQAAVSLAGGR
jgi:pimeloyl-ACP methyl ester carboxylesterase